LYFDPDVSRGRERRSQGPFARSNRISRIFRGWLKAAFGNAGA